MTRKTPTIKNTKPIICIVLDAWHRSNTSEGNWPTNNPINAGQSVNGSYARKYAVPPTTIRAAPIFNATLGFSN